MSKNITVRARATFEREGYLQMDLDEYDLKEFKELSEDEQIDWLEACGEAVLTEDDEGDFPCPEDILGELLDLEILE